MAYVLEEKVATFTPVRANRLVDCYQSWKWEQRYICDDKEPLEEFVEKQENPGNWQITKIGGNLTTALRKAGF